jgi:hypothetical protein
LKLVNKEKQEGVSGKRGCGDGNLFAILRVERDGGGGGV